jgi:hypothetical protein
MVSAFAKSVPDLPVLGMIIRGQVITDNLVEVSGRGDALKFLTPDAKKYIDLLPLGNPGKLAALYDISLDDIFHYLVDLGKLLDIHKNKHLQMARDISRRTSPQTPPLVDGAYARLASMFTRESLVEVTEKSIGIDYLEGWVPTKMLTGATVRVRCFGARCMHIVPGNGVSISAFTVIRNALLRGDSIIKTPSNDPFTAWAIAQTMCDMAPDHPVTKHLTVAYWRGGDTAVEENLYQPHNIEKIIAWGGFASVKHVTRYIQPGLELISLDPKNSASIVGQEAFASRDTMREASVRIATDVGAMNQNGCVNARVVYVVTGTDSDGLAKANLLGQLVYGDIMNLPESVSTKPKKYDRELRDRVDALRLSDEWYRVIGGRDGEGAVIVSQIPEPVDFSETLIDRTVNIVPVDRLEEALAAVNSHTQTVGIFPERLKDDLLNLLPLYGAQRIVSLGYAASYSSLNSNAHDGLEPMRRMGKWILDEIASPETVTPLWKVR